VGNNLTMLKKYTLLMAVFIALPVAAASVNIAAVVNDSIITTSDVEQRRDIIMATAGIPMTVENQQKITPRIVQSLIDESLELQDAKSQSITITDEEVNKQIDGMGAKGENNETLRNFIKRNNLSMASVEGQVRAQMAWNKVVQKKLRRNVNVSQDEVARAQKSSAAAPGEQDVRIQAITVKLSPNDKGEGAKKIAEDVALQIKSGADMATIAAHYIKQPDVHYNPPVWVPEPSLPGLLQQVVRDMKPGDVTAPLRGNDNIQIMQLMERQTVSKQADNTEFALKQIAISVPPKSDKKGMQKLRLAASMLRTNPGDCMSETIPKVELPTEVKFVRTKLGNLSQQQRSVVTHLEVGDVSEPLPGTDALHLILMCEKIEPAVGNLPAAEGVRQQLFEEKLELEAQKRLRNLRRDAYIDIKGAP